MVIMHFLQPSYQTNMLRYPITPRRNLSRRYRRLTSRRQNDAAAAFRI